ncbi:MAG: ribonuclease III [Bacillota bacterium]|jgi:ribonuclease-3|nr:ribonuclease III [Bacillota bacterium]HHU30625.1 ribonuclease III [Bacillota bacterium]
MKEKSISFLLNKLNITPNNTELYFQAVTHSSYAHEHNLSGSAHNERLEFLGDAVLELLISEMLYHAFPKLPEGRLTRFRSELVCEESLFKIAVSLNLGSYLRLGKGEKASGGRCRPSLLADAFEALLGAVYLDLGIEKARAVIKKIFSPLLEKLELGNLCTDFKTMLQEYTQARLTATPEYKIVSESGPDHNKLFVAQVLVNGDLLGEGSGRSKKEAEQAAARFAYNIIMQNKK